MVKAGAGDPGGASVPEKTGIPGTRLTIESRRAGGPPARIDGDRVVLEGEIPWILRGPAAAVDSAQRALAGFGERLDSELLAVRFGNAVGRFRLEVGSLEVVSGKWTTAHFDSMLADLTAKAAGLPFRAGASGALPYERSASAREDVLYHAFVYLRHATLAVADPISGKSLEPLPRALRSILADPHRRWDREDVGVEMERVVRIDEGSLLAAVSGREPLGRVPPAIAARVPLARALAGHLPRRLPELRMRASVDTPENRFVKAFLDLAGRIIGRMRAALARRRATAFSERLVTETREIDRVLEPFRRAALWNDVGRMVHFPAASTVLQRRRGYRQVFGHFARLQLTTRLPLDRAQIDDLLELKDVALLYEVWTFFALADEITEFLGPPREALTHRQGRFDVKVPEDRAMIRWSGGTVLRYNPRFSRHLAGDRRSYSVPLRPDLGLWIPSGPNRGLHLLDAKFRLERVGEWARDDSAGIEAEERRGVFKRVDLYKMHTYRDAIPDARSVWVLYPGTEGRLFGCDGHEYRDSEALPEVCDGVGALPFSPGDENRFFSRRVLGHLLC